MGDWLPRSFLGSFHLLFAAIRVIYIGIYLTILSLNGLFYCDVLIADQITFHLPILKLCTPRILFYCHFPDKLLAPKKEGEKRILRALYKKFLDWAEEFCLAWGADKIVVNSKFTQTKFNEAFKTIKKQPEILYPGVEIEDHENNRIESPIFEPPACKVFLSLNRFERKKDLHLALEAFRESLNLNNEMEIKLIVAGGYDTRVKENREHLIELQNICDNLNLKHFTIFRANISNFNLSEINVLFLPSISQEIKSKLLDNCLGLIYTPSDEHFGIVPIEAMARGLPVIAINSGGPKETIKSNKTGFLCDSNPLDISKSIDQLIIKGKKEMGVAGKKRVQELFSLRVFGDRLAGIIDTIMIIDKSMK